MKTKYNLQDAQYDFPYHHLVDLAKPAYAKKMVWGFEYAQYLRKVIKIVEKKAFNSLLDVGCGDGKLIFELAKNNQVSRLVGLDLSERAIAFARAFNLANQAEWFCGPLLELKGQFEVITLIETLEHVSDDDIKPLLGEMSRLLAFDGLIIVSVPTDVLPVSKKHYRHYNLPLLTGQLADFFKLEKFTYTARYNWFYRFLIKFYGWFSGLGAANRLTGLLADRFLSQADQKNGLHLIAVFKKNN